MKTCWFGKAYTRKKINAPKLHPTPEAYEKAKTGRLERKIKHKRDSKKRRQFFGEGGVVANPQDDVTDSSHAIGDFATCMWQIYQIHLAILKTQHAYSPHYRRAVDPLRD